MYPLVRNRRLRTSESVRRLVRETVLSPNDFLVPLFVVEGKDAKEEIPSMPGYYRLSLDHLETEAKELWKMCLCAVLLFVKVTETFTDNKASEALNPDALMQRALFIAMNACPSVVVMTYVPLDTYSA